MIPEKHIYNRISEKHSNDIYLNESVLPNLIETLEKTLCERYNDGLKFNIKNFKIGDKIVTAWVLVDENDFDCGLVAVLSIIVNIQNRYISAAVVDIHPVPFVEQNLTLIISPAETETYIGKIYYAIKPSQVLALNPSNWGSF